MFIEISDLNRFFNPQGQVNILYTLKWNKNLLFTIPTYSDTRSRALKC